MYKQSQYDQFRASSHSEAEQLQNSSRKEWPSGLDKETSRQILAGGEAVSSRNDDGQISPLDVYVQDIHWLAEKNSIVAEKAMQILDEIRQHQVQDRLRSSAMHTALMEALEKVPTHQPRLEAKQRDDVYPPLPIASSVPDSPRHLSLTPIQQLRMGGLRLSSPIAEAKELTPHTRSLMALPPVPQIALPPPHSDLPQLCAVPELQQSQARDPSQELRRISDRMHESLDELASKLTRRTEEILLAVDKTHMLQSATRQEQATSLSDISQSGIVVNDHRNPHQELCGVYGVLKERYSTAENSSDPAVIRENNDHLDSLNSGTHAAAAGKLDLLHETKSASSVDEHIEKKLVSGLDDASPSGGLLQPHQVFAWYAPSTDEMRGQLKSEAAKAAYHVQSFYHETGFSQRIARHHCFEQAALSVIMLNALYMAIDADYNKAESLQDASMVFQVCENLFCIFFTGEVLIRFAAFKRKFNCLKDAWFVFDSALVSLMVLETWVMAYILPAAGVESGGGMMGNSGILRVFRLLRLTRMSRMARIMRSIPEVVILLKAMGQACSSCVWTALMLMIVTYVWALVLNQVAAESDLLYEKYFSSIPNGMYTLMVTGCFLKGMQFVMDDMKAESALSLILYFFFILISGVCVMKMLTGMLCKVINEVAANEKEERVTGYAQDELLEVLIEMGICDAEDAEHVDIENLMITPKTFADMLRNPRAMRALMHIDIDLIWLMSSPDFIFPAHSMSHEDDPEQRSIRWTEFMENILKLRSCHGVTMKDIINVRKFIQAQFSIHEQSLTLTLHRQADLAHEKLEKQTRFVGTV